jgi:hypothetical protein
MNKCPECNASLDGGGIFETLRPQDWCAHMDDDELRKYVEDHYGAVDARFSRVIGVEYRGRYDGVWEWRCPDCAATWPRFAEGKR